MNKNYENLKKWRKRNPDREKAIRLTYYNKNRDKILAYKATRSLSAKKYLLMRNYGLTWEEYQTMMKNQDGKCAICKRNDVILVVDHCHQSGIIRKLLCSNCNKALGFFKDDPSLLEAAAEYIKEFWPLPFA